MFKIIISELTYFKYFFTFIFGIILLFFFGTISYEELDLYSFMSNSSIIFFISVGIFGSSSDKEKRERLHKLLPFSVKTLGKQRLLFVILYQACVFLLWLVLYFAQHFEENPKLIWPMISMVMFNLIIICFFVIYTDLGFWGMKIHKPILALIIAFSIFLYAITMLNIKVYVFYELNINTQLFSNFLNLIKLPFGAISMTVLTFILYYLSYVVYLKRKSYLA